MKNIYTNIINDIEKKGEERVRRYISSFSCPLNPTIENFVKNRANFRKRKRRNTFST